MNIQITMALIQIKTTKKSEQNSEYVLGFLKILWPPNQFRNPKADIPANQIKARQPLVTPS